MSSRGILVAVVVVGAAVLAGGGWWLYRPAAAGSGSVTGGSEAGRATQEGTPPPVIREARYPLRMQDVGPTGVAEAIGTRVRGETATRAGAALADTVEDTLGALLAGNVGDVTRYFDTYGIEPPPLMRSAPEQADRLLAYWRGVVERARFDPEGVRVSSTFNDEPPSRGYGVRTSERPKGRPFLRSLPHGQRRVAEVALPVVLSGRDGTEFEATWRVRFTFDPEGGQWVLTQHRFEGIPADILAPAPPV